MQKIRIEKKLIIYIGNFELPDKNAAAQRVIANGKIFRDLGYKVIFIGTSKDNNTYNILKTKAEHFGFDCWKIPYPNSKKQWLKQIINPVGLKTIIDYYATDQLFAVICYNYPALAQAKVAKICTENKAFCIPDITEWPASRGRGLIKGIIKALDTKLRISILSKRSEGIITTSPYLTKYYKGHVKHILELPTLYDREHLTDTSIRITRKKSTINFLYAGSPFNLNVKKIDGSKVKDRLDKIISLFSNLTDKNFILNIYGLKEADYLKVYPEHKKIVSSLKSKLVFHGRKPHTEIIDKIRSSDFTIFFRESDRVTEAGFPSKFSESITCGTPVITNDMSNIRPHLKVGKNGFLVDLNNTHNTMKTFEEIFNLSTDEIEDMKKYCQGSMAFDYRSHIKPTQSFLESLRGS